MDLVFNDHDSISAPDAIAVCRNSPLEGNMSSICFRELEQAYANISAKNTELAKEYLKLEQAYANISVQNAELEMQLTQTQASLACVLSSHSWQITAPIRKLLDWIRRKK